MGLLFENEKKKRKISEKCFLRKPIALLFENENEKNDNPQNLRKRVLWQVDPIFPIFGGFEKSTIFFLREPIALLFENEKEKKKILKISEKLFLRKPIALFLKMK